MSAIGPKIPATPGERAVWADWLLQHGHTPPWPLQEKPTKVRGNEVAATVAQLMSRIAAANATLAGIDKQREAAEAELKTAEEALEGVGITSMYQLTSVGRRDHYAVCAEPSCAALDIHEWGAPKDGWRCDKHQVEPLSTPAAERAAAALDEDPDF